METTLRIKIVGNYSISQVGSNCLGHQSNDETDDCKICHNPDFGDVIIEGICGRCLLHHYDTTIGLWATDLPEELSDSKNSDLLFEIK